MRKGLLLLLMSIIVLAAQAKDYEDQTLFGQGDINHGGFGGFTSEFTSVDDSYAYVSGWKGAWVINRTFSVGYAHYSVSTDVTSRDSLMLDMNWSGLEFEYVHQSENLLHMSAKLFLGSGTIELELDDEDDTVVADDHIFVLQPAVTGEVNIARWFRIGAGLGYRFVADVELDGYDSSDMSGITGQIVLKFGWDM